MRKELLDKSEDHLREQRWLDLPELALVSLTSEDPNHPIENALRPPFAGGWRAQTEGPQTIRLTFSEPVNVERIRLKFVETAATRTQEFVVRCGPGTDELRDVVRQQWNFSPAGATYQVEEYALKAEGITIVQLEIVPDISGGSALATMEEFRVG